MAFTGKDKVRAKAVDFYYRLVTHLPTIFMYSLCFILTIICIDRAEKFRFSSAANNELHQNAISQEVFDGVKAVIQGASVLDSTWTIVIVILCFWASQFLLRRAAGFKWSRTVTLPIAVEFSSAMRKMGKLDFAEQMACIYEHRISVYIANDPILEDQGENIHVKLYPYVRNNVLVLEGVLTKNIGKRQLCLNAADYEPIYQQYCQTAQSVALAKITALKQEIAALEGALSLKDDENKGLILKNTTLQNEKSSLEKELRMFKPRKGKDDKGDIRKIPLWRVLIPLCDRLKEEAQPGAEYTRPQIRREFLSELEKNPNIKEAVQELLWPTPEESEGKKDNIVDNNAKQVPDWVINIIREDLQHLAKRTSGAPPKAKKDRSL